MATHFLSARLEPATGPIPADALPVRVGTFQQGVSVQATCGVFLALSWITVMLRLYTRGVLVHNIGSDDWWILLAVVSPLIRLTINNRAQPVCRSSSQCTTSPASSAPASQWATSTSAFLT